MMARPAASRLNMTNGRLICPDGSVCSARLICEFRAQFDDLSFEFGTFSLRIDYVFAAPLHFGEDGAPKFQQMDVSSLVPLLIAEIQQLRARVAALEA